MIIGKKPIHADYSTLTEKIESNLKAPKFKGADRVRLTNYKNILAKVIPVIGQKKYFSLILY